MIMIPFDEAIISAMKKIAPSVVNIANMILVRDYYHYVVPIKDVGSGLIIDPSGFILTNAPVIEGTGELEVTPADGRNFPGKVVELTKTQTLLWLR